MVKTITFIPLLLINTKLISNFKMKENHFNIIFASHCILLDNNSKVPESKTYMTNSRLYSLHFEDNDIIQIIRSLDTNKAHDHDDISIMMLKICDSAIIKLLSIISRDCMNHLNFPDIWKKSIICPIHKKGGKQEINIYRPISLLANCGKIFEILIFRSLFKYLEKYKLSSGHQSDFRANDYCVDQLMSFVHNIYTAFGAYSTLQSRRIFWICLRLSINYSKRGSFLNLN